MAVPVSLAETNGKLRTGQKAVLANLLTNDIECPKQIELQGRAACSLMEWLWLLELVNLPMPRRSEILETNF